MKKSKVVRLVLLGSTGLVLVACDQSPPADAKFFANAEECAAVHDRQTCETALNESRSQFASEAPKFSRKEECEAEFGAGNCESGGGGSGIGGFFLPMMMGYMLGNTFRQPVYRGPNNGAMMRNGDKFFNVGQFTGPGRSAAFQPTRVAPVQRGGFGSTASSYRPTAGG